MASLILETSNNDSDPDNNNSAGLYDIGVIGLAVMGQNLILNMNDQGFRVLAHNRTSKKIDEFINGPARLTNIKGAYSLEALVSELASPRKIMLMVRAGEVVDAFIERLLPLLSKGDIIIDGGNSNFPDTTRRVDALSKKGIRYLGCGVSGGEEGARYGPSIMPGGDAQAWPYIKPIFQAISAKTDAGEPCCDWVGAGGAGHFVKMVHNGIEYGDMQLIGEAYHFMKTGLGMSYPEMKSVFDDWNKTELNSYLIEITAIIMGVKDELSDSLDALGDSDDAFLLEKIRDTAGQKGTGKWTGINALDLGIPLTLISEAVFSRCLSSMKDERVEANKVFARSIKPLDGDKTFWLEALRQALLASKVISYAQGFMLMQEASDEYAWNLSCSNVAKMWRGGCIIRSGFLNQISDAFIKRPKLHFLGMDEHFKAILDTCDSGWREVAASSIRHGIPMPCITSALTFLDGYTADRLPANLIQAQRDFFGAHTYERCDKPDGTMFHTNWTGRGGDTASTNYDI